MKIHLDIKIETDYIDIIDEMQAKISKEKMNLIYKILLLDPILKITFNGYRL